MLTIRIFSLQLNKDVISDNIIRTKYCMYFINILLLLRKVLLKLLYFCKKKIKYKTCCDYAPLNVLNKNKYIFSCVIYAPFSFE